MLRDNPDLQETKIGSNEIGIFAERMHDREMNSKYVQMLTSCCSCKNEAVPGNQNLVEHVIFGDNKDLLIRIERDDTQMNTNAFANSIATPLYTEALHSKSEIVSKILGEHLLERGKCECYQWTE